MPQSMVIPYGRRVRLLIVDDEPKLLRTYSILLGREYDVVAVDSGEKALRILEADPHFDVIVCDLHMPGVDGIDVFEHLRAHAPELVSRILFSTGSVLQARVRDFLARNKVPLLEKPFQLEILVQAIHSMVRSAALDNTHDLAAAR